MPVKFAANPARFIFLASSSVFFFLAVAYNEFIVGYLETLGLFRRLQVDKLRTSQIYFLAAGLLFLGLAEILCRTLATKQALKSNRGVNVVLMTCSVFTFFFIAEMLLRPIVIPQTRIFMPDDDLEWKLRPGVEDEWAGEKVKINGKGLRGPELAYEKEAGTLRCLYLGDSVTFGFRLARDDDTIPYLTSRFLKRYLSQKLETINAGVGGYSPWQEYIYLTKEGIRYDPDLVVISFVMNDVTEKLMLKRYGGNAQPFHLMVAEPSGLKDAIYSSALVTSARWFLYLRTVKDNLADAEDESSISVEAMIAHSYRPRIRRAWSITLGNLGKMYEFCREKNVPVLLVIFPWVTQFEDIERKSEPQQILIRHANEHGVPFLDLLPVLSRSLQERSLAPGAYFLDEDHLNVLGSRAVARILADFIHEQGLLDARRRFREGIDRRHRAGETTQR